MPPLFGLITTRVSACSNGGGFPFPGEYFLDDAQNPDGGSATRVLVGGYVTRRGPPFSVDARA
jgi:hypothetical protein